MTKIYTCLVIAALVVANTALSQITEADKSKIKNIYSTAEQYLLAKKYATSLEYLNKEGAAYLPVSDSLLYLKIKNLEALYRTDLVLTKELESSLKLFSAKANKYSFPELKYAEVSGIYASFQGFRAKDKAFYDSVTRVTNLEKPETLPGIKKVATEYLKNYVNTYYTKDLNGYIASIDNKLTQLAFAKKKREQDSVYRRRVKDIGKKMNITVSYLIPSGSGTAFTSLNTYNEIKTFFDGKYTGGLGEKYVLNASVGSTMINLYSGSRAKVAIDWSIFDGEYAVFDWSSNKMLKNTETGAEDLQEIKSIKAGTRIGPLIAVALTKKIAVAVYYNARPGIQFLMKPVYFSWNDGTAINTYTVAPVIANYNFSNEVGIKLFFFGRVSINPYLHFGNYNWKNDIKKKNVVGDNTVTRVQANYTFNNIGIRLGF